MKSPIYAHPLLYELSLRLLYRSYYLERYRSVADEIKEGETVVDLCAGDCALYRYALKHRNITYLACDNNKDFVIWAKQKGIQSHLMDLVQDKIPKGDCLVLMGSLYQFMPHEREILEKIASSARKKVIVTEPIRNWAQSKNFFIKKAARWLTQVQHRDFTQRFTADMIEFILRSLGFHRIKPIAGGRELIAVLDTEFSDT